MVTLSFLDDSEAVYGASESCLIRCPSCKHHKDLENPGMGQTGSGCRRLRKRQERSFLLTLAGLIEAVAAGQDLLVLC